MSRAVKTVALTVLCILLAALLGLGLFLSSHPFDEWARTEATRFLEQRFQVRANFGQMDVHLWRGSVEIDDLRLEARENPGPEPAISARHVVVNFSILDTLFNDLPLDEVRLDQLRLNLRRDPNGRLNLANMFSSGKPNGGGGGGFSPLKVKISAIHLSDAKVSYEDHLVSFNTESEAFHLDLGFDPAIPSYKGSIELHALELQVDDVPVPLTDFEADFQVQDSGIRFTSIRTESPAVSSQVAGAITSFSPFRFDFDVAMTARLPQFHQPDLGEIFETGDLSLQGKVLGGGEQVDFEGSVHSDALRIKGLVLQNLTSQVHVDQDGARMQGMAFDLLGGTGSLQSQIWWDDARTSFAELTGKGLHLDRALDVFGVSGLPLRAINRVTSRVTWPGVRIREFSGPGELFSDGELIGNLEAREQILPFSARALLQFGRDRLRFDQGVVRLGQTTATCAGEITYRGDTSLTAEVQSPSSEEIWTVGRLFDLPSPEFLARYPVGVRGAFEGRVQLEHRPDEPIRLTGSGRTETVEYRGEPEGSLRGEFRLLPDRIEIEHLELIRPSSQLGATLILSRDPVAIRRLTVDGNRLPLGELTRLGFVDASWKLSGRATVQADLEIGPDWRELSGSGTIRIDDGSARGLALPRVEARAAADHGTFRLEPIEARLWGGRVTGSARYDFRDESFRGSLKGRDLELSQTPLSEHEPAWSGTVELSIEGSGTVDSPHVTMQLASAQVQFGTESLADLSLEAQLRDRTGTFSAKAGYLDRPAELEGSVRIAAPFPFEAEARIADVALTPFLQEYTNLQSSDITGSVGARIKASGNLSDPTSIEATGTLPSFELSVGDYGVHLTSPLEFSYRNRRLTVDRAGFTGRDTDLTLGGTADLDRSDLNFKIAGKVNLRLVNAFLSQGDVQGELELETSIAGPIEGPRIVGSASLSGFFLGMPDLPVSVQNGHGQFKFTTDQLSIDSFSGRTDYGDFTASGGVFLDGFVPVRWQINATANSVDIPYPEGFNTVLDADVDFAKGDKGELLSGAVYVRSAEYTKDITIPQLILQFAKGSPVQTGGSGQGAIALDLTVEAYRSLRVNNNLADVIASGDFTVVGTIADPVVLGSLTVDEGTLKLEGNQYDVTRGAVSFDNPRRTNPYFNFEAETQVRDYDISIVIHGPVDQLQMTFRSEPPLSTSNIVSLLAAGQTEQEILGTNTGAPTRSGTLVTFGAGTLLTKTLGAAVQNQASRLFGIDRFSIDPFVDDNLSRDPGARITLGKQITQDLGISYISSLANSFQEQTVVIEYKLTDWLTAVGTSQTDGTVAIDFKLRKRF